METVKCVGSHGVDLSDGRWLAPGETAEDVSLTNAHNKDLLDQGHIATMTTEPAPPETETESRPPQVEPPGEVAPVLETPPAEVRTATGRSARRDS